MAIGQGIYHGFPTHAFLRPEEIAEGVAGRHRVVVVGGGPVGLTVAVGLARHGVPCVVVEPRDSVTSAAVPPACGNHYLAGQPHLVEEAADRIAAWAVGRL